MKFAATRFVVDMERRREILKKGVRKREEIIAVDSLTSRSSTHPFGT
jgi:hypothetical protein